MVCQIGKLKGLKVIAIAGSDDKCTWLEQELGVDKALNYKSATFADDLRKEGYMDMMFDNVGGDILNLCLTRLNKGARIAVCGRFFQMTFKALCSQKQQVLYHNTVSPICINSPFERLI
jgi:NADPH-dependent curcumin reductase CurA